MPLLVSVKGLAQALDLSERRINQLTSEGIFEKEGGKFDVKNAIENYMRNKLGIEEKVSYEVERALHEKAKREKAELQVAKLKNELHEASDVEIVITGMLVTFKNKILSLSSKVAPQLIGQRNINKISDILDGELRECLVELSQYDPKLFIGDDDEFEENIDTISEDT